jgi:hypothetical protein
LTPSLSLSLALPSFSVIFHCIQPFLSFAFELVEHRIIITITGIAMKGMVAGAEAAALSVQKCEIA